MKYVDTHTHLDGEEFRDDLPQVIERAQAVGVSKVFLPAIDLSSVESIQRVCRSYPGYAYPMIGLHPEEVKADFREVLAEMRRQLDRNLTDPGKDIRYIAVGEVGLDFYWSREFQQEQLEAFEAQVKWSVETRLPLSIHCRKGQNEMIHILKRYAENLPGGVFHCFTGNEKEAAELLAFDRFALGIGGVLTFKSSHLPEVLPHLPLSRLVLETDSPYMAPVPMRGKRNESAFVKYVLQKLAACYAISEEEVACQTTANVQRIFGV
ncbi:TatD family hydrolase [Hoylesella enoeca]|uniref:TatD family hydrolase n=1 Tax=Hoylesella enoeca TaxID=76123 RepID=UPI00288B957E|nr:TatD family hydrolase [Hoylesella enoeca]